MERWVGIDKEHEVLSGTIRHGTEKDYKQEPNRTGTGNDRMKHRHLFITTRGIKHYRKEQVNLTVDLVQC